MSDARAAATYGNRLTALAYSRSWMENPVSALTPDARKKREKKSDGTWQKRVVKATKKVMRQQEIDRSEERRVGKSVSVRVDLGGRSIIKKKKKNDKKRRT